jgi:uncharacterized repeat protein (TIGR01451 family)
MKQFLCTLHLLLPLCIIQAQTLLPPCEIQARIQHSICFDPPGCITLRPTDITGANPPYQYLWDNGHTGNSIGYYGNDANQEICHTLTITDALGCRIVISDSLSYESLLARVIPDTILYDAEQVEFDLSANDSTGFVEYLLIQNPSHGQLSIDENGIATFIPDDTWCGVDYFRYVAKINCKYTPAVTCLLSRTDCSAVLTTGNDCNSECTGNAYLHVGADLLPPLVYEWSNGEATDTVQNLCAGQHTLTVTDAMEQVHVFEFEMLATTLEVSVDGPTSLCSGGNLELGAEIDLDGEAAESVIYTWTGDLINQSLSGENISLNTNGFSLTTPKTHQFIATTQGGCIDSASHTAIIYARPSVNSLPNHQLYFTPTDLVLETEFEGGTPPYQFLWTGPNGVYSDQPTLVWPDINPYYDGLFVFRVTDSNGCIGGRAKSYSFPEGLNSNIDVNIYEINHALCTGSDLWVQFSITGGAQYGRDIDSIRWTGPNGFYLSNTTYTGSQFHLENLQAEDAGTYYLEAFLGPYILIDSMELEISPNEASVVNTSLIPAASCVTPTGGSFTIEVDGPGPFRSKVWGAGSYLNSDESPIVFENMTPSYGGRPVEIRTGHADLCYVSTIIPEFPHPVSVDFNITTADCQNQNGMVSLEIDPPAQRVRWNIEGQFNYLDTIFMAENVPEGWHSITIENAAGCSYFNVPFYMPAAVSFDLQMNSQPSCDDATGELEVLIQEPSNGTFDVMWSNGASGLVNTNIATGWYSVTVTDESGCERHENFFLPASVPCLSTISGRAYINTDCVCEADSNYLSLTNLKVCATSDTYTQCTFTNYAGEYTLVLPETGTYEISSMAFENSYVSENCLPSPITISSIGEQISAQDIYYCGEAVFDAAISINSNTPRPGFEQTSNIRLRNTGVLAFDTTYINATISPLIDVTYISPQPVSFDPSTNEITWESRGILNRLGQVDFVVRGTVIGDLDQEVTHSVTATIDEEEAAYDNNESEYTSIIVGSYDPNDKQVFPRGAGDGGSIYALDSLLHYTIRFQNTGTDTAFTVVIRDTLDQEVFDLNSVRPIRSSHPVAIDIDQGNILVFSFFDILLPDSTTSLLESVGYVEFDIELKPGLPTGTPVENSAAIYFDFNEPIITNTTLNTITPTQNLPKVAIDFEVFPNPSNADVSLHLEFEAYTEGLNVEIFDLQGRLVQRKQWANGFPAGSSTLPLSTFELTSGLYLIKLSAGHGTGSRKWIKL